MQRRLAAIVHADLAGFTRMMEGAETRTFRHLKSAQIEVWRPAIDAGNGRLVGTAGDAMLAEFGSAVTAVAASRSFASATSVPAATSNFYPCRSCLKTTPQQR